MWRHWSSHYPSPWSLLLLLPVVAVFHCYFNLQFPNEMWFRWKTICLQCRRSGFDSWVGKIPWRREWLPTPVFFSGERSMDRGAWWATVYGVTKSETLLRDPHFHFFSVIYGAESYDYLPFVYLLWWSFYSDILPIFKLDYLFSCCWLLRVLCIFWIQVIYQICVLPIFLPSLFSSVQFSCPVMSDSLQPHEPQHARPPCPSPTPGVHPNSCPSSQWCHPAISSSVVPFSSCPQSFPVSGSFQMSQLFTLGGQSIGVSALASVLPKNTQGSSPSEWTGWISLQSKGLSRVFSNTTLQKHQFFGAQLSLQSVVYPFILF